MKTSILLGVFAGVLGLVFSTRAGAVEWPVAHVLKTPWLIQVRVEPGKEKTAKEFLTKIDPESKELKATLPNYLKDLAIFREEKPKEKGQQLGITLRQAEVLGIVPPLEGLAFEKAVGLLKLMGVEAIGPKEALPKVMYALIIRLKDTRADSPVEIWRWVGTQ